MRKDIPRVTAVLIAVNITVFLLAELLAGSTENTSVLIRFGGAYVPLIREGQWWRLFASMFLHAGIRHLLNNMLVLYVMGMHLESLLGRLRFALLYFAGGLISGFVSFRWYERVGKSVVAVGASGAIFAVIGALLWIILRNRGRADGLSMRQMLIMLALSLYLGFVSPNVSNIAHLSGLAAGFAVCILIYRNPERRTDSNG